MHLIHQTQDHAHTFRIDTESRMRSRISCARARSASEKTQSDAAILGMSHSLLSPNIKRLAIKVCPHEKFDGTSHGCMALRRYLFSQHETSLVS
jgi:hypothetical protein